MGKQMHHRFTKFQFPPNGKAHVDPVSGAVTWMNDIKFQFPPNGKAHVDWAYDLEQQGEMKVFQFPPNGKAHVDRNCSRKSEGCVGFNSLQTGRHM